MDATGTNREQSRARRDDHLVEPLFAAVRSAAPEVAAPSPWRRLFAWLGLFSGR